MSKQTDKKMITRTTNTLSPRIREIINSKDQGTMKKIAAKEKPQESQGDERPRNEQW